MTEAAAASGTVFIAGLAERAGDRFFNSSVLVRPDGSREVYRKVHLFMDEKSLFEPGDLGFPVFEACGTTVGMMICFDWIFPEAARSLALAGAEILCHPSNLLLPWGQAAMITRRPEMAVALFSLLFFPGVLLHETSHYLMAKITGPFFGIFSLPTTRSFLKYR